MWLSCNPGETFLVIHKLHCVLIYVYMSKWNGDNCWTKQTYHTCEIFNQITRTRWTCFTMNKIYFNEVTENHCPGLYIFKSSSRSSLRDVMSLSVLHSKKWMPNSKFFHWLALIFKCFNSYLIVSASKQDFHVWRKHGFIYFSARLNWVARFRIKSTMN